ncbi:MAG: hypothetical protein VXZ38_10785, partial [Planctomycetota bacterium]|nr:hypothetical protein [Planctomycetota bacterium]
PPSSDSTPKSIASVAGGTSIPDLVIDEGEISNEPIAASNSVPQYGSQPANFAAAQANGFTGFTNGVSSGESSQISQSSASVENSAFGDTAFTPKNDLSGQSVSDWGASGDPSSLATGSMPSSTSSTHGFLPPSGSMMNNTTAADSTSAGFTLPTDSPSIANLSPENVDPNQGSIQEEPPISQPDYSTATRSSGFSSTLTDRVLPPAENTRSSETPGYSPGSTGTGFTYPTDGSTPTTTSGSYFR